jgi:hypothetical protein
MKNDLLLLRRGELKLGSTDAEQRLFRDLASWGESIAATQRLVAAERLVTDNRCRVRKSAERLVIDGPFAETRELVIGLFIIRAANIAEAARLAGDCPAVKLGAEIEVREIADSPSPEVLGPLDDAG